MSEELRTARLAVARTVRTLGFDPVSQDNFPTGYGELRQWLRTQLDSCQGLIQLVGDGYGPEPPDVDQEYSRVSYTQLEFRYAHSVRLSRIEELAVFFAEIEGRVRRPASFRR